MQIEEPEVPAEVGLEGEELASDVIDLKAEVSAPLTAAPLSNEDVDRLYAKIQNPTETLTNEDMAALGLVGNSNTAKVRVLLGSFMLDRLARSRQVGSVLGKAAARLEEMIPTLDPVLLIQALKLLGDLDNAQADRITNIVQSKGAANGRDGGDVNSTIVQILNHANPQPEYQGPLIDGKNPTVEHFSKLDPDRLNRILRLTQILAKQAQVSED